MGGAPNCNFRTGSSPFSSLSADFYFVPQTLTHNRNSKEMAPPPFLLAAYARGNDGYTRQLFAVSSPDDQKRLTDYAASLGGGWNGNWYAMPTWQGVAALQQMTTQLGGHAFDLPKVN